MTKEQAMYILLILSTFPDAFFWREATEVDFVERQKISDRYQENRALMLFSDAMMIAKAEFIQRIAENGIPADAGTASIKQLIERMK